jgi:hypothetical protein
LENSYVDEVMCYL